MTDTLAILKGARALITDPSHWTTGVYARKMPSALWPEKGQPFTMAVDEGLPACYCAIGAIMYAGHPDDPCNSPAYLDGPQGYGPTMALLAAIDQTWIPTWNDTSDHETVLAGFDEAIAMLEAA